MSSINNNNPEPQEGSRNNEVSAQKATTAATNGHALEGQQPPFARSTSKPKPRAQKGAGATHPPAPPVDPPGPPNSLEAEQSTLGAMMMEREAITGARKFITASDLYRELHQKIFNVIVDISQAGDPVDMITVGEELRRRGLLEEVGGAGYLEALIYACPSAANVEAYARIVQETSRQRRRLNLTRRLVEATQSGDDKASAEIIAELSAIDAITTRPARFPILTLAQVLSRPRLEYLLQDVLLERGTSVITADYGAFKSFNVLDIGLCIATGKAWHGRPVKRGTVVYIIAEGAYTTAERVRAWAIRHQLPIPENFHVIETGVQIADPGQCSALLNEIRELAPAFIIFDTLAKCNVGRDENDSGAMGLFTDAMEHISRDLATHCMAVHHNNKAGTARGSNSLPANIDTHIVLERSPGRVVTFKCDKQKGAPFEPFSLIGRIQEIPEVDEYGRPVTSLVFEQTDVQIALPKSDDTREKILSILKQAPDGLRPAAWQKSAEAAIGCKRSTFYGHVEVLEKNGQITKKGYEWFVADTNSPVCPIPSNSSNLDGIKQSSLSNNSLELDKVDNSGLEGQTEVDDSVFDDEV